MFCCCCFLIVYWLLVFCSFIFYSRLAACLFLLCIIFVYWSCASVCVCVSVATCPHYCTDLDVTWGSDRGCHLVVHYWVDLQSVHGFRCYDNIAEREMSASTCTCCMRGSLCDLVFDRSMIVCVIAVKVTGTCTGVTLDGWRNTLIITTWKNTWNFAIFATIMRYWS